MAGEHAYDTVDKLVTTYGAGGWGTLMGDPGITDGGRERLSYAESLAPVVINECTCKELTSGW